MRERVLPSIPFLPGENKQQQYYGAPQTENASKLLHPDNPVELAYPAIAVFMPLYSLKDKQRLGLQTARQLAEFPHALDSVYDYWSFIGSTETQDAAPASQLKALVAESIYKAASESRAALDTNDYYRLFTAAEASPNRIAIERLISGYLIRETPSQLADRFYSLVQLSYETGNDQLIEYLIRVLSFSTGLMAPDSDLAVNWESNLFVDQDESLKQFMEVDAFVDLLSPFYDQRLFDHHKQSHSIIVPKLMDRLSAHDKYFFKNKRFRAILAYYDSLPEVGFTTFPEQQKEKFPYNLAYNAGPVRKYVNERYLKLSGSKEESQFVHLHIPGDTSYMYSRPTELGECHSFFQDILAAAVDRPPQQHSTQLSNDEIRSTIDYLRPEIASVEAIGSVTRAVSELRQEIAIDPKRFISPKGTEIVITDPQLRSLGYERILFAYADKKPAMRVTIYLGKAHYTISALLDTQKRLVDANTGKPFHEGAVKADYISAKWLEAVVLGHLAEYMCSDSFSAKNIPPEEAELMQTSKNPIREWEQRFYSRIGHLRRLQPHEHCSQNQIDLARDEQGWNLVRTNEARALAGLAEVTYVRIVDRIPMGERLRPDRFRALHAMDRLNNI